MFSKAVFYSGEKMIELCCINELFSNRISDDFERSGFNEKVQKILLSEMFTYCMLFLYCVHKARLIFRGQCFLSLLKKYYIEC